MKDLQSLKVELEKDTEIIDGLNELSKIYLRTLNYDETEPYEKIAIQLVKLKIIEYLNKQINNLKIYETNELPLYKKDIIVQDNLFKLSAKITKFSRKLVNDN
jgi:hypothetical protein